MAEEKGAPPSLEMIAQRSLVAQLGAGALACLLCAAFAAIALSGWGEATKSALERWCELGASCAVAAGTAYAAYRSRSASWRWMASGACFAVASQGSVAALGLDRAVTPALQALDVLALSGFLVGAFSIPKMPLSGQARRKVFLDAALATVGAALVLWVFLIGPLVTPGDPLGEREVSAFLCAFVTLGLFWVLLALLFTKPAETDLVVISWLAGGTGGLSLGSLLFSVSVVWHSRGLQSWATLGISLSFLAVGLAGALQGIRGRGGARRMAKPRGQVRWPTLLAASFSGVSVALAFWVLYSGHADLLGKVVFSLVLIASGLFIARQAASLREESELRAKLQEARDTLEEQVEARTSELNRKLGEVTTLSLAADIASRAESEAALIAETTNLVRETLFPDICGVLLVDPQAQVLRSVASFNWTVGAREIPAIPLGRGITGKVAQTGRARRIADTLADPDYMGLDSGVRSEICVPISVGGEVVGVFNAESRKPDAFSESDLWVLNALASQMGVAIGRLRAAEAMKAREARFRALIQNSEDLITVHEPARTFAFQSPSVERASGYAPHELEGKNPLDFVHPDDLEAAKAAMVRTFKHQPQLGPVEFRFRRKDGSWIYLESYPSNLIQDPAIRGIVLNSRDVTARKLDEARIRQQLERLKALHAIDAAIGASSDMKHTLQVVVEQILSQLGVDGACVLLLDEATQSFRYAAGRGFRVESLLRQSQPVDNTFAGQAVTSRGLVQFPDLLADSAAFARSPLFREEMFVAYFAAPLLTKDKVVGVLEVFRRAPLHPDGEWLNFLEILAGQAAIAVENASLFDHLQRSHADLSKAYDTTLLGWSRALELRDHETQGHTQRVTDLTVRLARLAGIPESELLHVRRGALLHDIGKVGIPDAILLKPGPLTPEEWAIMKRHVDYACELLSPIHFLEPAMDIPSGHHERWDGTGYPLGLRGEAIPLSARVFAIVDNWDALSFDRPYRCAWPEEKVRAYLKEEAGRLFDPRLVELFLGMETS